jgi:type I restriction-modification system DNA methylase subunit
MQRATNHNQIISFIWNVANKLRGPYRPPQYRRVMLPMIALRRFDLVLSENKEQVLAEKERLEKKGITGPALRLHQGVSPWYPLFEEAGQTCNKRCRPERI